MTALLKELYSAPELARLVGISRWRMRRMLRCAGVEEVRVGRVRLYQRRSIQEMLPALWDAVLDGAERDVEERALALARMRAQSR